MSRESDRADARSLRGLARRASRSLPPIARRDALLAERDAEIAQLRRRAEQRGAGPESWSPPSAAKAARIVRASGLFDAEWYRTQLDQPLPDDADAVRHYLAHDSGQLSPHPAFVPSWYLSQLLQDPGYGSRRQIRRAPLLHYLTVGARRGLSPHPAFDASAYAEENGAARAGRFGPLGHFLGPEGTTCVSIEDHDPVVPRSIAPRRRTPQEFLAAARHAAEAIRDSRGHDDRTRDRSAFDEDAEAELKASLLAARRTLADEPLVCVVLPTRDRAQAVRDAVSSVLSQTYRNLELVVVDDGGTDETAEVLADLMSDPRASYVRHPESRGMSAARNTAIAHARGELIAYLDPDTTWRPDFLELMVTFLATGGHRVGYAVSELVESGGRGRTAYRGVPFSAEALRERNFVDGVTLVHERTLVDEVGGFDPTLRRDEDWDLVIRLAEVTDFGFLPVIAASYDLGESHSARVGTEEPVGYRMVVRQRTLLDWTAVAAALPRRDPGLVSVVVVATMNAAITSTTVERARATASGPLEVLVVDAHLPEQESTRLITTCRAMSDTRVHRLTQPLSLEVARNLGASLTRGGTLVFLDETAWCEPGWDVPLVGALHDHAAAQPLLLGNGGSVWSAGLHFADGAAVHLYQRLSGDAVEVRGAHPVDAAVSACLAVRAGAFVGAGGFDPLVTNHRASGELSIRLSEESGLPSACVGSSRITLRAHAGSDTRPGRIAGPGVQRDNERLQRRAWGARHSRLDARLADDGVAMTGIVGSDDAGEPGSVLLVHDRPERPLRWAIKIGASTAPMRENWGDWHFAEALRDALERLGQQVSIDCRAEWYRPTAHLDDVSLVLRGLGHYRPHPQHTNAIWVISHPDRVALRDLTDYDLVFGASARWCERVSRRDAVRAEVLLQCTDERRFHPDTDDSVESYPLLAVANVRGGGVPVPRPSVAAALEAGLHPAVFGLHWEGLLPAGAWKGPYVPNEKLAAVYSAAGAVLNDHWADMRDEGLLSNRLFDLAACDARVISDHLPEIEDVFGDVILTYRRADEIPDLLRIHQTETDERRRARVALGATIRREHTFDARARVLIERVLAARRTAAG